MEDLLFEFAMMYGIPDQKVEDFLNKKKQVSTLDELEKLPKELLQHYIYIPYCPEPLQSYISDRMWVERYMTIELERVAECIRDDMDYDDEGKPLDTENNRELQEIIDCMVRNRFGSVEYDW